MIQLKDVVMHKEYSLLFQEMYFCLKPHFQGALTEALTYMPKAGDTPPKLSIFRATESPQGSWVPKQGSFFKGLVPLPF